MVNQHRLTKGPADDFAPAYAPNGKHIAFTGSDGDEELYAMRPNGSHVRQLTHNAAFDERPTYSPNSKLLAFDSDRAGSIDIFKMRADGSAQRRLTHKPNGPHYQVPAIWGSYTDPLFPAQVVHNLEHGGIFIQYGPAVPKATLAQLQAFYNDHQNGTLLAPLPSLGAKIALGAWVTANASTPDVGVAHLAKCTRFDEKAFAAFFDNYQFQGPERFPASTLTPGT